MNVRSWPEVAGDKRARLKLPLFLPLYQHGSKNSYCGVRIYLAHGH
jgi:hypothetical protein